jgi:hypothetical protein
MATSEDGEIYRRGHELTVTFQARPKDLAFLRQWSDAVPTLYFLDICAANITKRARETHERDAGKLALFDRLTALDLPQNTFSYLLAFIEKVSDPRNATTDAELEAQILGDMAALRAFFTKAHVAESDGFFAEYLPELRGAPHELMQDAYLQFIRALNDRFGLRNPVAKSRRLTTATEMLEFADSLSIARYHPVVLVALGCLYENQAAKKVMKFREDAALFNAENALSDIMTIVRFLPRKPEIEHIGRERQVGWARSSYITDDNGLSEILRCFKGEAVQTDAVGDVHQTLIRGTVDLDALLPELGPPSPEEIEGTSGSDATVASERVQLIALLSQ